MFFCVFFLVEYLFDEDFDLYVLGVWIVDYGRILLDMKDFIVELVVKFENVVIFGIGEI